MNNHKKAKIIGCEEALERMFEYIDGVLAGRPLSELEQHIETCKGCLKKVEFQLKLKKRLINVKPVSASKHLMERLNFILG
jgi:hypothetical protein